MAQSKVIKYELEGLVMDARRRGRSVPQIKAELDQALAERAVKDTITTRSIERYMAKLDAATVPAAHTPQAAADNARLAVDVAARMNLLDETMGRWLGEAEQARVPVAVGSGESMVVEYGPDWHARVNVARELRKTSETVVNLLERIHNAERIAAFQAALMDVIRDCDPATAHKITVALRRHQQLQADVVLGAPA